VITDRRQNRSEATVSPSILLSLVGSSRFAPVLSCTWIIFMRIAISGTHCCGKSTLIDEFLITHSEYTHEPEAYETMQDELGESFAAEPSAEDFRRQLEHCVNRLEQYRDSDNVIFERCPADYLAYMLALRDLGRDSQASQIAAECVRTVRSEMKGVDVIVLLRFARGGL